jgi:hypothetical protein
MIGHPVENMGRGQPVPLQLSLEVFRDHGSSLLPADNQCRGSRVPIASPKDELNVQYQCISSDSQGLLTNQLGGPKWFPIGQWPSELINQYNDLPNSLAVTGDEC